MILLTIEKIGAKICSIRRERTEESPLGLVGRSRDPRISFRDVGWMNKNTIKTKKKDKSPQYDAVKYAGTHNYKFYFYCFSLNHSAKFD